MARNKHPSKKLRLAKHGKRTCWAPFWTVPKIFGLNRRVHPGRQTHIKRHWRKNKIKI